MAPRVVLSRSLSQLSCQRIQKFSPRTLPIISSFSTTTRSSTSIIKIIPKKGGAPTRAGVPYVPGVKANGLIWVSGQTSVLEDGSYLPVESSVSEKTHRMCQNARAILEAAGSSLDKVVKVNVIFTELDRDYDEFNKVYAEYFPHHPARTSVEVKGLPKPADLEIELVALE